MLRKDSKTKCHGHITLEDWIYPDHEDPDLLWLILFLEFRDHAFDRTQ